MNNLIPTLPEPWVFDGYRRIYDDGKPTELWQARAVDLTDAELEPETSRVKVSFKAGQGTSFEEALEALLAIIA